MGPWLRASQPVYLAPLLILLIATPHYGATLLRVYEQRSERKAYALFTVWATIALIALFVLGVRDPAVGTLLFTVYLTWSPWHYTGQNYGIAMLFLRRRSIEPTPAIRRWLHGSFFLSFVLTFLMMHRAEGASRGLAEGGVHLARLGIPDAFAQVLIPGVAMAYGVSLVGAAALLLRRGSPRDLLPVALIALSQSLWFTLPDLARYAEAHAGLEPLAFDHRAFYFNWVVLAHAVQYLWVTAYYARASSPWRGAGMFLGKTLLAGNLVWLVPALVFAPQLFGGGTSEGQVALLVASLVNLHHFVLDGAIWKLRRTRIANVLIRSEKAEPERPPPIGGSRLRTAPLVWVGAALLLGLALFEFGAREIAIPARVAARDLDGARALLDQLARVGRDSATLRLGLGHFFVQAGRNDEAALSYVRSGALTPSVEPFVARAQLAARQGDGDHASALLEEAVAMAPDRTDVLTVAGRIHAALGDEARARAYFVEALRLDPAWAPAREGLEALRPPG